MFTCPSIENWEIRSEWCDAQILSRSEHASHLVSEQACALFCEAQTCYCSGAWVAVLILCYTALDAHLREVGTGDYRSDGCRLLNSAGLDVRYQKLRKRRNRLIHVQEGNPSITIDDLWDQSESLEAAAQEAIKLTADVFFMSPGA